MSEKKKKEETTSMLVTGETYNMVHEIEKATGKKLYRIIEDAVRVEWEKTCGKKK